MIAMTVPINVLSTPSGRSITVTWDEDPSILFFNVYASIDGGEFDLAANRIFGVQAIVSSLPVDIPISIKVDGVLADGKYTEKVDAKLGERTSSTLRVKATSMRGSRIKEGTVMTLKASHTFTGGQVLIRFPNEVNF